MLLNKLAILKHTKAVAFKSGQFIKSKFGKIKSLNYKTDHTDVVTDVDKKSEQIIKKELKNKYPDFDFLGEEGGSSEIKSNYKWLVDPIDGTTNFSHSLPIFSVSIGLEYKNEIILGVVYNPMTNEMFYGLKGYGAFLNGKRIKASKVKKLKYSLLVTGFSYQFKDKLFANLKNFQDFLLASQAVRRLGSAALDICYTACGRFDGYWERGLKPWDTAAGFIIAKEAGCLVTKFDGSKYSPYDEEILVTNSFVQKQMINIIKN